MQVNVGGQEYEIGGIAYGTVAAWQLVKRNGEKMTAVQFDALPETDKLALTRHVQAHIDSLNK